MYGWYLEWLRDNDFSIKIPLDEEKEYKMGRNKVIDIVCTSPLVSRQHAIITVLDANIVYIRDTNSSNGVYINDQQIPPNEDFRIQDLDLIGVGAPTNAIEPRKDFFKLHKRQIITEEIVASTSDSYENISINKIKNEANSNSSNLGNPNLISSDVFSNSLNRPSSSNQNVEILPSTLDSENGSSKPLENLKVNVEFQPINYDELAIKKEIKNEIPDQSLCAKNADSDIIEIMDSEEELFIDNPLVDKEKNLDTSINDCSSNMEISPNIVESEEKIQQNVDFGNKVNENINKNKEKLDDFINNDEFSIFQNKNPIIFELNVKKPSEFSTTVNALNLINNQDCHDSDDDFFPESQLFDDFVKEEPKITEEEPIIPKEEPIDDEYENIFSNIKRENIFEDEFNPPRSDADDSDDEDCVKWFNKLSQSQGIFEDYAFSTDIEPNYEIPEASDINNLDEEDRDKIFEDIETTNYKFNQDLLDIKTDLKVNKIILNEIFEPKENATVKTSAENEKIVHSLPVIADNSITIAKESRVRVVLERNAEIEKQIEGERIIENEKPSLPVSVRKELILNTEIKVFDKKCTSPIKSPTLLKKLNDLFGEISPDNKKGDKRKTDSKKLEKTKSEKKNKKEYVKPPVIEAPFLKKGKRKAHDSTIKVPEVKDLKRKFSTEERAIVPSKKIAAPSNRGGKAIRQEFEKRSSTKKRNKRSNSSIDNDTKQQIKEERKKMLKKITENKSDQKENNQIAKIKSTPKVKVSSGRGLFLADDQELEPPKKKFIIPKKKTVDTNDNLNLNELLPSDVHKNVTPHVNNVVKKINKNIPKSDEISKNIPNTSHSTKNQKVKLNDKSTTEPFKNVISKSIEITKNIPNNHVLKSCPELPGSTIDIYQSFLTDAQSMITVSKNLFHKSCLRTIKKTGAEGPKKRVSFKSNGLVQINEFEIEQGCKLLPCKFKDAPIPGVVQKPKNQSSVPTEEDALLNILNWVPKWLEEQKHNEISPKVSNYRPMQMLHTFNSVGDYYHIVTPLLLLELWNSVFREWQYSRKNSIAADILSVDIKSNTKNNLTRIHCLTYLSKRESDMNMHPNRGDLIILEIMLDNNKNDYVQKFGFVVNSFKKRITNKDSIDQRRLAKIKKGQVDSSVTFTIHTKPLSDKIKTDKIIRIRVISYIAPCLRIFKSVAQLRNSPLCDYILKPTIQNFKVPKITDTKLAITDNLDSDQLRSVLEACQICSRPEPGIYMIQGPPGTGKSLVITNIIRQLLYGEKRCRNCILLCAPSNGAVDEITIRLLELRSKFEKHLRFKMLRIGPHNSIHPKVRDISLQNLVKKRIRENTENIIQDNDLLKVDLNFRESKVNTLQNTLFSLQASGKDTKEVEKQLLKAKDDLQLFYTRNTNELSNQERLKLERNSEAELLEHADIICTTLSSSMGSRIEELYNSKKLRFSCCIVDEATQSNEQETLMPLMLGISRLVLVGDPAQLPATVLSQEAKNLGYGQSLFARIQDCLEHLPENPIRVLQTQYRMHNEICKFPNEKFYGGKLKTPLNLPREECLFHPYKLFSLSSQATYNEDAYVNIPEANFVLLLTHIILLKSKMTIGIITPYSKQKALLIAKFEDMMKGMKNPRVDVNTVDGFQGQERDIIIFSPVRFKTNLFLNDHQRINVSFTRAKYALFVCAQENLFKTDHIWKQVEIDGLERNCLCRINAADMNNEVMITSLIIKN